MEINASSLNRFMACNGSAIVDGVSLPSITGDTTTRDEGTAAHWLAEQLSTGNHAIEEYTDRKAPNGIYITPEIAEHVQEYLEFIAYEDYSQADFEIDTSIFTDDFVIKGRADFYGISGTRLNIFDFKYGWRIVEPEYNWTLISHAISVCMSKQYIPSQITFTIYQPRPWHPSGPCRRWTIDYQTLCNLWNQLSAKLIQPDGGFSTGPQCSRCPGLANCPAAREASANAVDISSVKHSEDLTNQALSFELDTLDRAISLLNDRKDALQSLAIHRLTNGQIIENYKVAKKTRQTTWKDGLNATTLSALMGIDARKTDPITPAEAKRQKIPEQLIETLTHRPSGGTKLSRVSAHNAAISAFKKD